MKKNQHLSDTPHTEKLGILPYLSLLLALVFFSGIMGELAKSAGEQFAWLGAFDFSTLAGNFGKLGVLEDASGTLAANFRGVGGTGPRDAFLFAVTLIPLIMFALGTIKVIERAGALKAAGKMLTPLCKFILGVPGQAAISIISNFQSSDAGPIMISSLKGEGIINEREQLILTAFEYSAPGIAINFFVLGGAVLGFLEIPFFIPLCIIILCKFIGANLIRLLTLSIIKVN